MIAPASATSPPREPVRNTPARQSTAATMQRMRTTDERPLLKAMASAIMRPAVRVEASTFGSPTVPAIRLRPLEPAAYANWDASGVTTTP